MVTIFVVIYSTVKYHSVELYALTGWLNQSKQYLAGSFSGALSS